MVHPCEAEAVFAQAMEDGLTQEELFEFTNIDPWFLSQFAGLHQARCPRFAATADPFDCMPLCMLIIGYRLSVSDWSAVHRALAVASVKQPSLYRMAPLHAPGGGVAEDLQAQRPDQGRLLRN